VTLNGSTVSGNTATTDGGGIYSLSGTLNGAVPGVNVFGTKPNVVSM
jgi:predicted outer membrane repeat protein